MSDKSFSEIIVTGLKDMNGFRETDKYRNCTNCKDVIEYSFCEPLCGRNPEFKFTVSDETICNKYKP